MRFYNIFALIGLALLFTGCAATQSITDSYQGDRYLRTRQYALGEEAFRKSVARNPDSAKANYYLGRFLLAGGSPQQAAGYLRKSATLDAESIDHLFWLGVVQGELGNSTEERKKYRQVLQRNPEHLQALIYLGNNLLASKQYDDARKIYEQVLRKRPDNPTALFNTALIARIQKSSAVEKAGWLAYLQRYPSGSSAILAAGNLNQLGDYTFRNHALGGRTVTLRQIEFVPGTDKLAAGSLRSLNVVGSTVSNLGRGKLQVLVFQDKNKELARTRAMSIRNYLLRRFPGLTQDRIGISWFGQPEKTPEMKRGQPSSVRFFLSGV